MVWVMATSHRTHRLDGLQGSKCDAKVSVDSRDIEPNSGTTESVSKMDTTHQRGRAGMST